MASVGFNACILCLFIGLPSSIYCITTIHHDKPEESQLAMKLLESTTESPAPNITLTPSERQKRLLPYEKFYLAQRFNLPANPQSYSSGEQRYQFAAPSKKGQYNNYPSNQQEVLYQPIKFTPFLESNAIPGPFRPMMNPPQPQRQKIKVQFIQLPQQESKAPDFGAIYDKLSQLKLVQRRPAYAQNYRAPPRYNTQAPKPQHVNFIPATNAYEQPIQPTKTVVETYTATNIDIPTAHGEDQYSQQEQYEQIPNPIKSYENDKQYQPVRKPYAQQVIVEVPQNYHRERDMVRKPIIILQQKPTVNDQPKVYHYRGENIETIPITKPVIYVPRKQSYRPKVVIVTEETPVSRQKYAPIIKYTDNPRYEQIPQPQKYETISSPYQQTPKYEEIPKYAQVDVTKYQQAPITNYEPVEEQKYIQAPVQAYEPFPLPQYAPATEVTQVSTESSNNLAVILKQLQETNTLPQTLTPENIDNSIKTLVKILGTLRKQQKVSKPIVVPDEGLDYNEEEVGNPEDDGTITTSYPGDTPDGGTPGKPGVDYPALSSIPQTSFNCKTQRYKGFFGDPDTNCQVWHYCDLNGGQASFLCPNGTIFSQVALTCDWWYNVKCASTAQLYVLNERLYKYIIPLTPKFPEDYSGPLVDKYLALKFQEMEDKMKKEKKGKQQEEDKEKESEELQNIEEEEIEEEEKEVKNPNAKTNTLQSVESGEKK